MMFKVGQKVKRTNGRNSGMSVGGIGTIKKIRYSNYTDIKKRYIIGIDVLTDNNKMSYGHDPKNLVLVSHGKLTNKDIYQLNG